MYNTVKLEKGLYNLCGKSFSQALEEADPSENYKGTPLAGLDAYERQLKRFDIKVSGENCDTVEKFFTTTESAVLFPEFVRRSILSGFEDSVLKDIIGVRTRVNSNMYCGYSISHTASSTNTTAEGSELPSTNITMESNSAYIDKFGRVINASYETVLLQRLDCFGKMLKATGRKIVDSMLKEGVSALAVGATKINIAGSAPAYSDILSLYDLFGEYNLTTILAAPSKASVVLGMPEVADNTRTENGKVILPFGAELIKIPNMSNGILIGIDKEYALEMITNSDIIVDTDKLIDKQLNVIGVSVNALFRKFSADAVKVLSLTKAS